MPRKSPEIVVEEISGNQFPDLETAQRAALPVTVPDLVQIIKEMLADGILVVEDGRIIPNAERIGSNER